MEIEISEEQKKLIVRAFVGALVVFASQWAAAGSVATWSVVWGAVLAGIAAGIGIMFGKAEAVPGAEKTLGARGWIRYL